MNTFDLSPFYRSSIGFDRLSSALDTAMRADRSAMSWPPYNIEVTGENSYAISLALAGFSEKDLDLQVENNELTVSGTVSDNGSQNKREYLHRGISSRSFEHKFNLDDYVEVTGARLENGMLRIELVKNIPEVMKPRKIEIKQEGNVLEGKAVDSEAA